MGHDPERLELGELTSDGRQGDAETPERSTSTREPTSWPVATYSSITRRRVSRFRGVSCILLSMVTGSLRLFTLRENGSTMRREHVLGRTGEGGIGASDMV
jgi:hypothetical protein